MGIFDFFKKDEKLAPVDRIDKIISNKNLSQKISQMQLLVRDMNEFRYSSDLINELTLMINDFKKYKDQNTFSDERLIKEIDGFVLMIRNRI